MKNENADVSTAKQSPQFISPAKAAEMLGVSRSQIFRLAARFGWAKIAISVSPKARNAGVRYALSSVENYIRTHTY